jgi:hypothetical protein
MLKETLKMSQIFRPIYDSKHSAQYFICAIAGLSPVATCGDREFKCGEKQSVQDESLMKHKLHFSKSDYYKVLIVATKRRWLETTVLWL